MTQILVYEIKREKTRMIHILADMRKKRKNENDREKWKKTRMMHTLVYERKTEKTRMIHTLVDKKKRKKGE